MPTVNVILSEREGAKRLSASRRTPVPLNPSICPERFSQCGPLGRFHRAGAQTPQAAPPYDFTSGFPGDACSSLWILAANLSLSVPDAAARRFRSFTTFSLRVRRRRISGRRLGADIQTSLVLELRCLQTRNIAGHIECTIIESLALQTQRAAMPLQFCSLISALSNPFHFFGRDSGGTSPATR